MNIEEIKKKAPDGATHYGDEGYWMVDEYHNVYMWVFEFGRSYWKYARPAQCLVATDIKPLLGVFFYPFFKSLNHGLMPITNTSKATHFINLFQECYLLLVHSGFFT